MPHLLSTWLLSDCHVGVVLEGRSIASPLPSITADFLSRKSEPCTSAKFLTRSPAKRMSFCVSYTTLVCIELCLRSTEVYCDHRQEELNVQTLCDVHPYLADVHALAVQDSAVAYKKRYLLPNAFSSAPASAICSDCFAEVSHAATKSTATVEQAAQLSTDLQSTSSWRRKENRSPNLTMLDQLQAKLDMYTDTQDVTEQVAILPVPCCPKPHEQCCCCSIDAKA